MVCMSGSGVCSLGERRGGGGIPDQPGQVRTRPRVRMQVLLSGSRLATLGPWGEVHPLFLSIASERGRSRTYMQGCSRGASLFGSGQREGSPA